MKFSKKRWLAVNDIIPIGIYTCRQRGFGAYCPLYGAKMGEASGYENAGLLDACFQKIGQGKDMSKSIIPNREDIRVCRCERHYVFYLRKNQTAIILAVLHERMDMIERLKKRLLI